MSLNFLNKEMEERGDKSENKIILLFKCISGNRRHLSVSAYTLMWWLRYWHNMHRLPREANVAAAKYDTLGNIRCVSTCKSYYASANNLSCNKCMYICVTYYKFSFAGDDGHRLPSYCLYNCHYDWYARVSTRRVFDLNSKNMQIAGKPLSRVTDTTI